MKIGIAFSIVFFSALNIFAQTENTTPPDTGSLTIITDPSIDYLLMKHEEGAIEKKTIAGYRVQLIANPTKASVVKVKTQFLGIHPDAKIYMTYFQPNYRLRVGDFKTKMEANQYLKTILHDFPAAWVVNDTIVIQQNDNDN